MNLTNFTYSKCALVFFCVSLCIKIYRLSVYFLQYEYFMDWSSGYICLKLVAILRLSRVPSWQFDINFYSQFTLLSAGAAAAVREIYMKQSIYEIIFCRLPFKLE